MKKIIAVIALCLLTSTAFAEVKLGSTSLNGKIGKNMTVDVVNNEVKPMLIKVLIEPETKKPVPDGAEDCSKTLRAYPKIFVLKEGDAQTIKFLSRKPGYCRVRFVPQKSTPDAITEVEGGGAKVSFVYRPSIPVVVSDN